MTCAFSAFRAGNSCRFGAPPRRYTAVARAIRRWFVPATVLWLMAGCAAQAPRNPADPFESVNRAVYKFNDKADHYVAKPIAQAYEKIVPSIVQTGIRNFFGNLGDVGVLINDVLQLKFKHASRDGVRLAANTVFGLLGFIDVAGMRGIPKRDEDFGQTLGYWGVGPGPYLVLPLLGPSTLRDAPATYVGSLVDPVWRVTEIPVRNSMVALRLVDVRARLLPTERIFEQAADDRYAFLRDAFLQRRQSLVYDGDPPQGPAGGSDIEDPGEGSADDPPPPAEPPVK